MKPALIIPTLLLALQAYSPTQACTPSLTAGLAKKIAAKAFEYGDKKNWKLSVAIVNSEGNLVFFERGDGAYLGSIEAAINKAKSANAFQRPTRAFVEGVKAGNIGLLSVKDVVANEGGLPIVISGAYVGGIGISGAKSVEDEEAASAALQQMNEK